MDLKEQHPQMMMMKNDRKLNMKLNMKLNKKRKSERRISSGRENERSIRQKKFN